MKRGATSRGEGEVQGVSELQRAVQKRFQAQTGFLQLIRLPGTAQLVHAGVHNFR